MRNRSVSEHRHGACSKGKFSALTSAFLGGAHAPPHEDAFLRPRKETREKSTFNNASHMQRVRKGDARNCAVALAPGRSPLQSPPEVMRLLADAGVLPKTSISETTWPRSGSGLDVSGPPAITRPQHRAIGKRGQVLGCNGRET